MTSPDRQFDIDRHPSSLGLPVEIEWLKTDTLFDNIVRDRLIDIDPYYESSDPLDINDNIIPDYYLEEAFPMSIVKTAIVGSAIIGLATAFLYFKIVRNR
jgi:hypothetical protein